MDNFIESSIRECVDRLVEVISYEMHEESEQLGLNEVYEKFCTQIEQQLQADGEIELWERYQHLLLDESTFFDAYEAYMAGREAKLNGEMDKTIAYKFYIASIKNDSAYQLVRKELNAVFEEISELLFLEKQRDKLTRIDQLYKRLNTPIERNLWIFFNLGYDCCPA